MFLYPEEFPVLKEAFKCPTMIWDIGGTDIFNARTSLPLFFASKVRSGKDWSREMRVPGQEHIRNGNTTLRLLPLGGIKSRPRQARPISFQGQFKEKYEIAENRIVLMAPSNPGSHKEQFEENLKLIGGLVSRARRS
jgi:hypothetical protein